MENTAKILWYKYRVAVLSARDPVGNYRIINKLKRRIRNATSGV